jgi:peptidoglycan-N-acetylglucosamine deacetylase
VSTSEVQASRHSRVQLQRRQQIRRRRAAALLGFALLAALVIVIVIALEADGSGHPRPPVTTHKAVVVHHSSFAAQTNAAINHTLTYTPYITLGRPRKREIALTFDDGPGPYTRRVLAVLRREHVHATFFEVGRAMKMFGASTKALAQAGDAIGDHTQDHFNLAQMTPAQQRAQVVDASKAIVAAGAPAPHLFRPPYGAFNRRTLAMLKREGLLMVLWSVDTGDYARPGVPRIVSAALNGAKPGGIVLMHDGGGDRSETVAALPQIILGLRRRGYSIVTVPHLVRDDPPPRGQRAPTPLIGAT